MSMCDDSSYKLAPLLLVIILMIRLERERKRVKTRKRVDEIFLFQFACVG